MHLGYNEAPETKRCLDTSKKNVTLEVADVECIECLESYSDDLDSDIDQARYDLDEIKDEIENLKHKRKTYKNDIKDLKEKRRDVLKRLEAFYDEESREDEAKEGEGVDEDYADDEPGW